MSTAPRLITLPTLDHGPVTLTCPAWCVGHHDHRPDTHRADILHKGPDVRFDFLGEEVISAGLAQSPFATLVTPGLGGRTVGVSMYPPGRTLDPVSLYSLAAALDGYADRLRDLADQLTVILAGGDR
ncbi:hypothetical protein SCAB_48441 [Streptomyces scabiei 87.22]|uniref:Uncharacterized protein n=1 Tax=Streptomyces scabiei (strain 87.22) TaxID=680198 RepID=C9ZFA9_STRSW|nr:hypothetical protein [Streptomyces scabiei]MDX2891436.1 hypothetical protein [Streptomyces scabiei]MDX2906191.1 hypothetical protein [Streptomyces scabiei]MDX2994500.1 hypothetical protein [Streptomyces scabiei]MDX3084744.1 hypothetical protein [Streptomyces scabiei]MDX3137872.1 hypothetical protein [Streptomyces scabiei]